jgi:NAD(P)-dependent dehydrogenase (short-subunit alcohol dehydrogenase family)
MYLRKINFNQKNILVTGAGKGLGKACALAMAETGGHVLALSRTIKDLDNLEKLINKTKGKITKIVCDVTNYQQLILSIKKIKKIDVLVNNAGTNIPELFKDVKQQSLERLINLNLKAAFNVAQLVVKKMLKNKIKDGAIVHLSSQLGHVSMEGRSVYSMTKFGIEGLTRGMALELAKKNIRVNAVCPTYVQTPLVQKVFKNKKFKQLVLSRIPMGKTAKEIDIASAVCFLASPAASMITGTSLLVDGGWTAQ